VGLRELGKHAAEVGLKMSLEMYEDTYLGTADSSVRLVEEIGLDNVGLNPDIGNLIRLHRPIEDWREMFAKTLPYANYWHVKNYMRDEAADGSWATAFPTTMETGLINYRQVVRDALALGFEGIFLMEQYGGDSLGVCATNRDYLRTLLPKN
jgi:sugar phosphate isomerase/epimerase